jgi:hypothetical protein
MRSFAILTHHNQIKDKTGGSGGTHGREQKYIQSLFVGEPDGKRLLGRPRRRKQDNIKTDIKEIGGKNVD